VHFGTSHKKNKVWICKDAQHLWKKNKKNKNKTKQWLPDCSHFHFYYRYFSPMSQEVTILFSSTHVMKTIRKCVMRYSSFEQFGWKLAICVPYNSFYTEYLLANI